MATTPPQPTPVFKQRKERKSPVVHGFGPTAPEQNLAFPAHANLTVVELLTFLPNSVRCPDVIYRFISNGGTRHIIWAILNTQRDLIAEVSLNLCGAWMSKAMKAAGYDGWTITQHYRFHDERKTTWDEAKLDVAGFRTLGQHKREHTLAPDIRFKDLVVGVRSMPQGDDAVDLTRMVRYYIQKPDEQWMYPYHYSTLLDLLGGPTPVRKEHLDRAAFLRWAGIEPPPPHLQPTGPFSVSEDELKEKRQKSTSSIGGNAPLMRMQSREATPVLGVRSAEATPAPTTQTRKSEWPKARPRKSVRVEETAQPEPMNTEEEMASYEIYIREPAEYIAAPDDAEVPTDETVELAFLKEGAVGETDPFNPYAFGGPRYSPPYRMLHQIAQPMLEDNSGWAENLRWAFEQHACFWHTFQTANWNESPEHMEFIARTRKQKLWASDELLELLAREQRREEENDRQQYYPRAH